MNEATYMREGLEKYARCAGPLSESATRYDRPDGSSLLLRILPAGASPAAFVRLIGVENKRVARVFDVAEEGDHFLVLTEYVPGITLAQCLKAGKLGRREIARVALDLCDALIELHGQGVAHKDVKPENVILDDKGRATLIDLGIATVFDEGRSQKTAALGTVGYAAPEQFGFNRTDARTDLYAFGVVLNLMLTHKHPTVERYRKGKYGRILKKCLAVSPDDRYKSARALKAALLSPW